MKLVIISDINENPDDLQWADLDDALNQMGTNNDKIYLLDDGDMTDKFWLSLLKEE